MPKIPTISPSAPPGVSVSPGAASAAFGAMEQAGAQISQTGFRFYDTIKDLEEKKAEIKSTNDALFQIVSANKDINKLMVDIEIHGDEKEYKKAFDQGFEAIRKRVFESTTDPRVIEKLQKSFGRLEIEAFGKRDIRGHQKFVSGEQAKVITVLKELQNLASESPEFAQIYKDAGESTVKDNVRIGVFDHDVGAKLTASFLKDFDEGFLIRALHSEDPEAGLKAIESGKIKHLDGKEIETYRGALLEAVSKKRDAGKEEKLIDAAYYKLKEDIVPEGASNYDAMFKKLADPKWQKENNLNTKLKAQLETRLRNEQTLQKMDYEPIQNDFLRELEAGTLTKNKILKSSLPATGLMQGDKSWFLDKLAAKKANGEKAFKQSNEKVYADTLKDVVLNPEKWDKTKIWALMGVSDSNGEPAGLSVSDTVQVWKVWEGLKSDDPKIAKKFESMTQVLERLEGYRKSYFFVEPDTEVDGKPSISHKGAVLNDKNHYLAQQKLLEGIQSGKDPFAALDEVMKEYVDKKTESFWDGVINFFSPAPPPPLEKPNPIMKKYEATATNPKTGEQMGYINGKWEPIHK